MSDIITAKCHELKEFISKFHHRDFVAHICYLSNAHWRRQTTVVKLHSPVRQLMYLISLYHTTEFIGNRKFEAVGEDFDRIVDLLNEIEGSYKLKGESFSNVVLSPEEANRLIITNSTFLNYYLNAPLSFLEQDVERIKTTFQHFESLIKEETGLAIQDYIDFFFEVTNTEIKKYTAYFNRSRTREEHLLILKARHRPETLTVEDQINLEALAEQSIFDLGISIDELSEKIDPDKVQTLLILFTLIRKKKDNFLYYTDPCEYLTKPILMVDGKHAVLLYSKQLINAIYEHLFELCSGSNDKGRKVLNRREKYLEGKTIETFKYFFGDTAQIHTNYYIGVEEKDLLILQGTTAYIIECKANKYRKPLRDSLKAYERIRDDFKKCIGKGHKQATEVEKLFYIGQPFNIKDKRGRIIDVINPNHFEDIFTIVVTQERFGQIQCDLGYLLDIDDDQNYPWAVSIDDLETFLITLKRTKTGMADLGEFLLVREKLQERVICYDELELCAYFLFDRANFIRKCDGKAVFISRPDVNLLFDNLYQVGFGFKDELNLNDKLKRKSPIASALIKKHKLGRPERITEFLAK